jgi:hypothetical protein
MPTEVPVRDADVGLVREFLADRDVPCPGCGYNLRGIHAARCPECERTVRLCVEGSEVPPRVRVRAALLLTIVLVATVGQVALWFFSGAWSSAMPFWYTVGMLAAVGSFVVENAVLLRLIVALRGAGGRASDGRALRWSMVWLSVHAAVVCTHVAVGMLFLLIL